MMLTSVQQLVPLSWVPRLAKQSPQVRKKCASRCSRGSPLSKICHAVSRCICLFQWYPSAKSSTQPRNSPSFSQPCENLSLEQTSIWLMSARHQIPVHLVTVSTSCTTSSAEVFCELELATSLPTYSSSPHFLPSDSIFLVVVGCGIFWCHFLCASCRSRSPNFQLHRR